jgi:hypothetical protein
VSERKRFSLGAPLELCKLGESLILSRSGGDVGIPAHSNCERVATLSDTLGSKPTAVG